MSGNGILRILVTHWGQLLGSKIHNNFNLRICSPHDFYLPTQKNKKIKIALHYTSLDLVPNILSEWLCVPPHQS